MSILAEIVARKKIAVAKRKTALPLARLIAQAVPTTRRFGDALRKPGPRFILECKRASPSEGLLRPDLDPAAIAGAYADVADAISVLTDTPYFQGSFDDLAAVRAHVDQPLLCKDFTTEPYQVFEARAAGADAVLLMLSVLDDAAWRECAAAATSLGMGALTEVHDEAELERALRLDAPIIGINNRNLVTLKVDPATTERLAPRIPRDRVIVCESGIRSRSDVARVAAQVDAFLVGGHLMKAPRVDLAARELIYGRVKVCGLTTPDAARLAWLTGASFGGLIFASSSPRCVSEERATAIAGATPLPLVGVFVDTEPTRVSRIAAALNLAAVQLHGDESAASITALRTRLPAGCEIWKAVQPESSLPLASTFGADRLLFDGPSGGSGVAFDWRLLADYPEPERIIVAGGLTPDNARTAQTLGTWAIDVNSGVESKPGIKDLTKLRRLFAALRGA